MVMMTCGENEENAENKFDNEDELGLEYEVDKEVELAEIHYIKKIKKIVV